ncbi:UNVERIFIED_CONTAM: AP-4 complex subunit epsilon, partial [Sesamum indicum]
MKCIFQLFHFYSVHFSEEKSQEKQVKFLVVWPTQGVKCDGVPLHGSTHGRSTGGCGYKSKKEKPHRFRSDFHHAATSYGFLPMDITPLCRNPLVESYLQIMGELKLSSAFLQVICWILGEYGTADGKYSSSYITGKFCDVAEVHLADDTVK